MYTEEDRNNLLEQITEFMKSTPEFEGLLQIGSGAVGYNDIYSDIDLMAGCTSCEAVMTGNAKLIEYFESLGSIFIDRRKWSQTVHGLSVYFDNGLSVDISYMPTDELQIRSPIWKILFSKDLHFSETVEAQSCGNHVDIDDSVHHKFIFALRRCEIAILRSEHIYADMALAEARQLLLLIEAAREGKKIHQFKAFNTLDASFLEQLDKTYPVLRDSNSLSEARDNLLTLYLDVVECCEFLSFDDNQLKLLNRFE